MQNSCLGMRKSQNQALRIPRQLFCRCNFTGCTQGNFECAEKVPWHTQRHFVQIFSHFLALFSDFLEFLAFFGNFWQFPLFLGLTMHLSFLLFHPFSRHPLAPTIPPPPSPPLPSPRSSSLPSYPPSYPPSLRPTPPEIRSSLAPPSTPQQHTSKPSRNLSLRRGRFRDPP